jgi:hypothetical protein
MFKYGKDLAISGLFSLNRVLSVGGIRPDVRFYHIRLGNRRFVWTLYKPSAGSVEVITDSYPHPILKEDYEECENGNWENNVCDRYHCSLSDVFHRLVESL